MILQIGTALAIGAYVVLSKEAQPNRPDAALASRFSTRPIISLIAAVALGSRRFMNRVQALRSPHDTLSRKSLIGNLANHSGSMLEDE
jgi:hypothetical protein